MNKLTVLGRLFFATAMIAFGVQHLIYKSFVTRVVPSLPAWVPGHALLAVVFGLFLIAAGGAIIFAIGGRFTPLFLGATILLSFTLLYLPLVFATPSNGGLWTMAGKALAMAGGSFLVAASLPEMKARAGWLSRLVAGLEKMIPCGRYFFAAFLILCGILHFIYVEFVETLVPNWVPGHRFITYFTGVALIAGGLGICLQITKRLAASLTAIMIFLWVILLHIPRAFADLHNSNEMTAVFEALAMTAIAILIATLPNAKS